MENIGISILSFRIVYNMISRLPEDLCFEISKYLSISDTLIFNDCLEIKYFSEFFTPYVNTIQRWFRKYNKNV